MQAGEHRPKENLMWISSVSCESPVSNVKSAEYYKKFGINDLNSPQSGDLCEAMYPVKLSLSFDWFFNICRSLGMKNKAAYL